MCPKEIGKRMADISSARLEHQALLSKLMSGPSDGEGAMRRAESIFGLSYWSQWSLRHKGRASFQFIHHLHQAYLAAVEKSVRRDLAYLQTEIAKGEIDAGTQSLLIEAENILAKIAERKAS